MNEVRERIIERSMRLVREATDMDAIDRAILNYVVHEALDRLQSIHDEAAVGDATDVDQLTAALAAAEAQVASREQQWTDGYIAGECDAASGAWYNRGARLATAERELIRLQLDLSQLRKQHETETADLRGCKETYQNRHNADADRLSDFIKANAELALINTDLTAANIDLTEERIRLRNQLSDMERALSDARTAEATIIHGDVIDATPAETAAVAQIGHRNESPAPTNGDEPKTNKRGFRYSGTDAQLKQQTLAAILKLAQASRRTPTIFDWNAECHAMGLPTAQTLQERLKCSWLGLVLDAGLTPATTGNKAEG
jgi:hypothetical protein